MKQKTTMARLAYVLLAILLITGLYIGLLYSAQDSIVYHPHPYESDAESLIGRTRVHVDYATKSGNQVAFYIPPIDGTLPSRLWIVFGGNNALALQYAGGLPLEKSLMNDAFLLIDYPGYGYNQGTPSAKSIQQSADAAFTMLSNKLHLDKQTLLARTGVIGHSLGTGVALEFVATHLAVHRIVLIAPFTSLYNMAFRDAGPAARLLHHNYDNARILKALGRRTARPRTIIVTGDEDQIIPVTMSRELAQDNPWLTYHELPGYEHNQIVNEAAPQIALYMVAMK